MYRSLGGWTFEFEGYWLMNITKHIDDPNMQKMADIIDPLGKKLYQNSTISTKNINWYGRDDINVYQRNQQGS